MAMARRWLLSRAVGDGVGVGGRRVSYITPREDLPRHPGRPADVRHPGRAVRRPVGLVRGGGNPARSNQLMRWRVILQGAALLLFALLMTLLRS